MIFRVVLKLDGIFGYQNCFGSAERKPRRTFPEDIRHVLRRSTPYIQISCLVSSRKWILHEICPRMRGCLRFWAWKRAQLFLGDVWLDEWRDGVVDWVLVDR